MNVEKYWRRSVPGKLMSFLLQLPVDLPAGLRVHWLLLEGQGNPLSLTPALCSSGTILLPIHVFLW